MKHDRRPQIFATQPLFKVLGLALCLQASVMATPWASNLTGNDEADQLIANLGVAAACAGAGSVAQNTTGAVSQVAQGAMAAFCGLPAMQQQAMMAASQGVSLSPIQMNGIGSGVMGMGTGMMPTGYQAGMMNGALGAVTQQSFGQMLGQAAASAVVQQVMGNMTGNNMLGSMGYNPYGMSTGYNPYAMTNPMGMAAQGSGNLLQTVGTAVAGAMVQNAVSNMFNTGTGGTSIGAYANNQQPTTVAGLSVLQGNAAPVYAPVYQTTLASTASAKTSNAANTQAALMVAAPQSKVYANSKLTWAPVNLGSGILVDTRAEDEVNGTSGVRVASGESATPVGVSLGVYSAEGSGQGVLASTDGALVGQMNPVWEAYKQGKEDACKKNGVMNTFLSNDADYIRGYNKGLENCRTSIPTV